MRQRKKEVDMTYKYLPRRVTSNADTASSESVPRKAIIIQIAAQTNGTRFPRIETAAWPLKNSPPKATIRRLPFRQWRYKPTTRE